MKSRKKIKKDTIKKIISTSILVFFATIIIFQKDTNTTELQFVRNTDEVFMHNAANQQRDYLFEDEWGQDVYQWQIATENNQKPNNIQDTIDNLINDNEIEQIINNPQTKTGYIYTGIINTGNNILQKTGMIKTWSLDCITPRKEKVKNKDFILAYEQRKDVNTICNIEKRVCMSGTLWWSFIQHSCKEDIVYIYQKAEVISYNKKVINEYIQPTPPVNSWAYFNTEGKINTTNKPIDTRSTTNNSIANKPTVAQNEPTNKASCTTPRGQKVKHGQFVKAYKSPRGFIDLSCETEIRPCVNGNLKWAFTYPKCTFNNTSYADYLKAGSPKTNTGFLFFQRIKSAFRK